MPEFPFGYLQILATVASITITLFTVAGSLARPEFRERFRKVISGDDDLEETSADATEKLFDNLFDNEKGRHSSRRILLIYAIVSALSFGAFRVLDPRGFSVDIEGGVSIFWLLLVLLGGCWFLVSYITSRGILMLIDLAPAPARPLLGLADILITHAVIVTITYLATLLNVGYETVFPVESAGVLGATADLSREIFTIERLYDQFALSQYVAAYTVTIFLWTQIIVGAVMRQFFGKGELPPEKKPIYLRVYQFIARLIFRSWADPNQSPFAATALVFVVLEFLIFTIAVAIHYAVGFIDLASVSPTA